MVVNKSLEAKRKTSIVGWFGAFHEVPPYTFLSSTIPRKESQRMALLFYFIGIKGPVT